MLKSDKACLKLLVLFPILMFLLSPFLHPPQLILPYIIVGEGWIGFVVWLTWGRGHDAIQDSTGDAPK